MNYIGMDVHKAHTVFCILNDAGEIVARGKVESNEAGWGTVLGRAAAAEIQLAFEIGATAWWLVEVARSGGIEPVVVDPRRFKIIADSRKKSDRRDAFELANALKAGLAEQCSVVIPSERARQARSLLQARKTVMKQSTMSRNAALALLRSVGVTTLTKRTWTSEEKWQAAVASPRVPQWMLFELRCHRAIWATVHEQRLELDNRVSQELKQWPEAKHLQEIPGYGDLVTLSVAASLDDPRRFRRAKWAGSYGGLAPSVRASATRVITGGITHQGSPVLRHAMVQAAHAALRSKRLSPSLRRWALRIMMKRGRQVAAVALARRLLVLGCRLMKTGEVYDPNYGAAA